MAGAYRRLTLVLRNGAQPAGTIPQLVPTAQHLSFAQFEDGEVHVDFLDQAYQPAPIPEGAFLQLVARRNYFDTDQPPISVEASVTDAGGGYDCAWFDISASLTGAMVVALYSYDVVFVYPDGRRVQCVPASVFAIAIADATPGTPIVPGNPEPPAGLGPSGTIVWDTATAWIDFYTKANSAKAAVMFWQGNADGSPRQITPPGNYPLRKFKIIGFPTQALEAGDDIDSRVFVDIDSGVTFDDQDAGVSLYDVEHVFFTPHGPLAANFTSLYGRLKDTVFQRQGDFVAFESVTGLSLILEQQSLLSSTVNPSNASFIRLYTGAVGKIAAFGGSGATPTSFDAADGDATISVICDDASYQILERAEVFGALEPTFTVFGAGDTAGAVDVDDGTGNKQHRRLTLADIGGGGGTVACGADWSAGMILAPSVDEDDNVVYVPFNAATMDAEAADAIALDDATEGDAAAPVAYRGGGETVAYLLDGSNNAAAAVVLYHSVLNIACVTPVSTGGPGAGIPVTVSRSAGSKGGPINGRA